MLDDGPWAYLNGLDYPATKLDVIAIAESNGVPQPMLEQLQTIPAEQFESEHALQGALYSADKYKAPRTGSSDPSGPAGATPG